MPSEARAGRLYGVGVGPGDPELLTRKAERILRQVDVVAVPKRGPRDRGYAFEIVASLLDPGRQEILDLVFPMTRDRERLEAAWESHVEALARRLRDGRDCAFITEGDPFLYSTFIPLWERLRARCPEVPVEVVPGVSSVTAAACRAGLPLASGGERVAILPAVPEDPGALRGLAAAFDTVVVMKAGAHGREVLDAWADGGLAGGRLLGVRRATTPSEAIAEGPEAVAALEPDYFSLFLLRGAAGRAAEGGAVRPAPGVYFIGAGPGAPDLITLRGREILGAADMVVYADSLVHPDLLRFAGPGAEVHGSSRLTLEEQVALMREAVAAGRVVARLHTGDPSLFGAIQEQMAALAAAGVPCRVVPGVTAATAAAAALGVELTVPGVAQTVILCRAAGRTPVPEREALRRLARHRATLCLYLSAGLLEAAVAELLAGGYPPRTPAALAHRVSWPDERVVRCRLHELPERAAREGIRNQALVLVGEALAYPGAGGPAARSRLYHPGFGHAFRRAGGGEGEA